MNLCAECIDEAIVAEARRHGKRVMAWFPCVPVTPGWKDGVSLGIFAVKDNKLTSISRLNKTKRHQVSGNYCKISATA